MSLGAQDLYTLNPETPLLFARKAQTNNIRKSTDWDG